MDLANPATLRTLRYVRTLNDSGIAPTLSAVKAYANAASPDIVGSRRMLDFWDPEPDETYVVASIASYLQAVQWIEVQGESVQITEIGRAIDARSEPDESEAGALQGLTVVLEGTNALAYSKLLIAIQRIKGEGDVMIVDPFFPVAHLPTLVEYGGVRRVLTRDVDVRDAGERKRERKETLQIMLGANRENSLEARFADPGVLHDRLIIPAVGKGLMLGRSLGGRQTTVVVELNETVTDVLRLHHNLLWETATAVEPADLTHIGNAE